MNSRRRPGVVLWSCVLLGAPTHGQDEAAEGSRRNALAEETSPYLLQHADNPVDWLPWGERAFALARERDLPIFLSSGYSACHWCHVMEHESFADERIAALLNERFVCVKLDREERPDVDAFYMAAVERMTGSGGWPLSVWMTPEREPFFGGTYFPPRAGFGRPSFETVLQRVHEAWSERREEVLAASAELVDALRAAGAHEQPGRHPAAEVLERFDAIVAREFDPLHGGFGAPPHFAPKFPNALELVVCLRRGMQRGRADLVDGVGLALREMARGGIHDQLAGGFARYATERTWTVPHFEKMLYDNALLAQLYLEAWQAWRDPEFAAVVRSTLDWLAREMLSPEGGFYSSTDADSEGVEGKYFVWTPGDLRAALDERDARLAALWFGVEEGGNFDDKSVLTRRRSFADVAAATGDDVAELPARLERIRGELLAARARRVAPRLDDKVLAGWNGLALSAFARAGAVLEDERYLALARRNAEFLLGAMRREDGGLWRTRRAGRSTIPGFLQDHAFVVQGLLDLWEADGDRRWFRAARELLAHTEAEFGAGEAGSWYSTAANRAGELPVRLVDADSGVLPSPAGVVAMNAMRIGLIAGERVWIERGEAALAAHGAAIERLPSAFAQFVLLLDFLAAEPREVFVVGEPADPLVVEHLKWRRREWPPYRVLASFAAPTEEVIALFPAAEGKRALAGKPTVYSCRFGVCELPRSLAEE